MKFLTKRTSQLRQCAMILMVFSSISITHAQTTITLNQPETGNQQHTASERVYFTDGYNYTPAAGNLMHAYISQSLTQSNSIGNLYTGLTFDAHTIDTNLPVGTVSGAHSITPSGGATYSVPIKLPPGRNGKTPSLSVNYNSQAGNGILGMGWNIGGVSVITRVPKSKYNNDIVAPVLIDNRPAGFIGGESDDFSLDGNRMIATAGTYGANGTTYGAENETFNRITSNGITGDGPTSFTVETKDGLTLEFGNTLDSKLLATNNASSVMSWYLSKVTDNYGNYYTYTYRLENDEVLVDKIEYGGNSTTGLQPFNQIDFVYNFRDDKNTMYIADEAVSQNVVLININITSEGNAVRSYNFSHGYDIFTYLTEIEETGSNGTSLNKTILKYGDISTTATVLPITPSELLATNGNANTHEYWPGDFNGDGKSDLLGFSYGIIYLPPNPGLPSVARVWLDMDLFISDGNGQFTKTAAGLPFPPGFSTTDEFYPKQKGQIGNTTLQNVDWNGDGMSDILFIISDGLGNQTVHPYISDGTTLVAQPTFVINTTGNFLSRTFDSDGDGKTELFVTYSTGTNTFAYELIFNLDRNDPKSCIGNYGVVISYTTYAQTAMPLESQFPPGTTEYDGQGNPMYTPNPQYTAAYTLWYNTWWDFGCGCFLPSINVATGARLAYDFGNSFVVDHDGDGAYSLENVLHAASGEMRIFDYDGSCFTISDHESMLDGHNIYSLKLNLYGDFNGDRKSDKLSTYPEFNTPWMGWFARYSKLTEFEETNQNNQLLSPFEKINPAMGYDPETVAYVGDFNGDGKSDILEIETSQPNVSTPITTKLHVSYSNGTGFVKKTYPINIIIDHKATNLRFGDFDGDDKLDIFIQEMDWPNEVTIINIEQGAQEMLLHKIKDGFDNVTEFNYDYLSNNAIYTKGNLQTYPLVDIQFPLDVVTAVKVGDGIGGYNKTSFKYEEAIIHKEGKGFLGFKKVISENDLSDLRSTTEYKIDNTFYIANPISTSTELITGNIPLSLEQFKYNYTGLGNKRVFANVDRQITTNQRTNFVTISYFSTNTTTGNVYQIYTTKGNIETVEVYNTYGQFGSWIPSRLTTSATTTVRSGQSGYQRGIQLLYNAQGSVTQEVKDSGDPNSVTKTYGYNNLGNQTSLVFSGTAVPTRTTNFTFDSKGRYVEQTTFDLGQTSSVTYDPKWGVPLSSTGVDGLVSTFTYDEFGVLTTETGPDNILQGTVLSWDIGSGAPSTPTVVNNSVYSNTITRQGKPTIVTWHDALGRERKKEIDGFSQKIYSIISYDALGNVKTETTPFYSSGTPVVSTHNYNQFNLLESSQNSAGTTLLSYTYSQNQVSTAVTLPDLTTTSKIVDATGKVTSATDAGGTVNYTYYSSGLEKETSLSGVVMVTSEYDLQGRQTKLIDKNAGESIYSYNGYGQLTYQKDANGNEFLLLYDILGRITKKTDIADNNVIDYTYVPTGNGMNQTSTVIESANNISEVYSYDNLGRVTSIQETINATPFTTSYQYDGYSNVSTVTYPSGFSIDNTYNQFGYLEKVLDNTTVIWQGTGMNAYGFYTGTQQGNGLSLTLDYDTYGFPEHFAASTAAVQDVAFTFDPTNGNLLSKYDAAKAMQEDFIYDNLNRLTQTKVNGVVKQVMGYANNGNIDSKTDAGTYTYDSNIVNGVIQISNPDTNIRLLQQDVKYTSFNSADTITEGNKELYLTYGPSQQRKMTKLFVNGVLTNTQYFAGDYEKIENGVNTTEVHYIAGGNGLAAIYVIDNAVGTMKYAYTDYQGSINTLTDASGNIVAEQSFDAWGRYRDPNTWQLMDSSGVSQAYAWLTRGYTGHEHLPEFELINMNGRLYDPTAGRMLSPDNFVQSPLYSQSYNRYSYAWNNPSKYTDPSGENIYGFIIMALFGYLQAAEANDWTWNPFDWASLNAAGESIYYSVGFGGNGSGVNSVSFGVGVGSANIVTANIDVASGVPGINWAEVNAERGRGPSVLMFSPGISSMDNTGDLLASSGTEDLGGPDIFYRQGSYNYSEFHFQYLMAEGKGLLGGWLKVKGNAQVHKKNGKYYANVSATAFTPSGMNGGASYSGSVDVYSDGELVSSYALTKASGATFNQPGWSTAGQATIPLPTYGHAVYLKYNIGYVYSEGAGYVSPMPSQGHHDLVLPTFYIDGWTY